MNVSNVLDGWENYLNKSEVTEELAKVRAQKCAVCPHLKHGVLTAFIKDDIKEIQGCYCGICKCPTSAKLRSEKETCSDNPPKW